MADFETKLRWLSERGSPVGAAVLIERIEADLAGSPNVVIGRGAIVSKTQPGGAGRRSRGWRLGWALAAFVAVLAAVGLILYLPTDDGQVADSTTTTTPIAESTTTTTTAAVPTLLAQEDYEPIGPGTYFVDADGDPSTAAGATVVIGTYGWIGSKDGVNFNGDSVSMHLHVFQEPFTPACGQTEGAPLPAGSTAADLVDGFAASGFVVLEAPAPVIAFGRDGFHVVVELPAGCAFGGDPGFTHYTGPLDHLVVGTGDVIEVWAFDMDGDIVMVEALWLQGYPSAETNLAAMRAVIDSLVLVPDAPPATAGDLWPQPNREELLEAQRLADAGDPDYTWQLDEVLAAGGDPWESEIFARFIEEELGWEAWEAAPFAGYLWSRGLYDEVLFIRCVPGQSNPVSSLYADAPPEIQRCASTIDERSYETVSVRVTQPDRKGPTGIWRVERWKILQPESVDAIDWTYPGGRQVVQIIPPPDSEVDSLLEAFLQARVDGEGAEQYLFSTPDGGLLDFVDLDVDADILEGGPEGGPGAKVPLLYATTRGLPYEGFEIERVEGPVWPYGWTQFRVRLFATGGTVVEQLFHVVPKDGELRLLYEVLTTTEDGQYVPLPFSLLDGQVTFGTVPPWRYADHPLSSDTLARFMGGREVFIVIAIDPRPECDPGAAPESAGELAASILAFSNQGAGQTLPVRIAGIDGLQLDVDTSVAECWSMWTADQASARVRLYLIDYPGDAASVLTIAVIAPDESFEGALAEAVQVVESLEIHAGG